MCQVFDVAALTKAKAALIFLKPSRKCAYQLAIEIPSLAYA
jgi:hypothetical protein